MTKNSPQSLLPSDTDGENVSKPSSSFLVGATLRFLWILAAIFATAGIVLIIVGPSFKGRAAPQDRPARPTDTPTQPENPAAPLPDSPPETEMEESLPELSAEWEARLNAAPNDFLAVYLRAGRLLANMHADAVYRLPSQALTNSTTSTGSLSLDFPAPASANVRHAVFIRLKDFKPHEAPAYISDVYCQAGTNRIATSILAGDVWARAVKAVYHPDPPRRARVPPPEPPF